jgi:prolyl-tRNA editing enzyme YbaK/EbsC (Cys-tRNA(Pro) deacylase)
VRTFVDVSLLAFEEVWAAAGTPDSVFPIDPAELVRMSGGDPVDLAER